MRLYIKQKVFSWRDRFAVKDEHGNDRWYAQGELFSWVRRLNVMDSSGSAAATIYRKTFTFLPKYYIELGGATYLLAKEMSLFKPKYYLEGLPWRMEGNFSAHAYSLYDGSRSIMRLSKEWFTWGDSYLLEIDDPRNELLCLCITLAVDCMNADAAAAS